MKPILRLQENFSNIYEPNNVTVGRTRRPSGSNEYIFDGNIDFIEVYGEPIPDEQLSEVTGYTGKSNVEENSSPVLQSIELVDQPVDGLVMAINTDKTVFDNYVML